MSLLIAAAVLSCGLNAAPDGTPTPEGSVAMINAPIPDELAKSMAAKIAPPPIMQFVGEPIAVPEWIIGVKRESEIRFMIARLSDGFLAYGVRIGWVDVQEDGTNLFTETAEGTCQIKESAGAPQGEPQ